MSGEWFHHSFSHYLPCCQDIKPKINRLKMILIHADGILAWFLPLFVKTWQTIFPSPNYIPLKSRSSLEDKGSWFGINGKYWMVAARKESRKQNLKSKQKPRTGRSQTRRCLGADPWSDKVPRMARSPFYTLHYYNSQKLKANNNHLLFLSAYWSPRNTCIHSNYYNWTWIELFSTIKSIQGIFRPWFSILCNCMAMITFKKGL